MEKTVTVISSVSITVFRGLSHQDLTVKNPAEHDRLNIRPMWASRLDENGEIQRFDFERGENECPVSVVGWESFKQLADKGILAIKDSYSRIEAQNHANTKSLEEIKKLEEEIKQLKEENQKYQSELKKNQKVKTIEA